jgi:hypothetical protein
MRKIVVFGLLFSIGCMTTPDSILELSETQGKVIDVLHKDTLDIINTYNYELEHWVTLAYKKIAETLIDKHTDIDGNVNMQEYFNDMKKINDNMLEVITEYRNNKTDIITNVGLKFEKAKRIQAVIDSYENSFGFDQKNIDDLVIDFSEIIITVSDRPEEDKEPDLMDIFYEQMMGALQNKEVK